MMQNNSLRRGFREGRSTIVAENYAKIAERYDLFYEHFDQHNPVEVEFFEKTFRDHRVRSVLDCACGTETPLPVPYPRIHGGGV